MCVPGMAALSSMSMSVGTLGWEEFDIFSNFDAKEYRAAGLWSCCTLLGFFFSNI